MDFVRFYVLSSRQPIDYSNPFSLVCKLEFWINYKLLSIVYFSLQAILALGFICLSLIVGLIIHLIIEMPFNIFFNSLMNLKSKSKFKENQNKKLL
jgi:hypothetical protein